MAFLNKYMKLLNTPMEAVLKPFVVATYVMSKPRFLFQQKTNNKLSREELKSISEARTELSDNKIKTLTRERLLHVEKLLIDELRLKPRIAVEYEFTFRDLEGKPVRLSKKEKVELDKILAEELPSFQESDKTYFSGSNYEYKFDTKGQFSVEQILIDLQNFKNNLGRYQSEVAMQTGINRPKLVIDETPYQPDKGHLGIFLDNTTSLHVNLSFEDANGNNFFAANRKSLQKSVASMLNFQLPSFALASDQSGLDRIDKGSSCVDMIKAAGNYSTGGAARFGKLWAASILANTVLALPLTDFYIWATPALVGLLLESKISGASSSVSYRTKSENKILAFIQRFSSKRAAKSASATRVENRLNAANQDPALSILNTIYPVYKALKGDKSKSQEKIRFKQQQIPVKPEILLNIALDAEEGLRELYGDELFEALFAKSINTFFPETK